MKLQTVLNKFINNDFILTVNGLCDEMPFSEYLEMKQADYWKNYKNREVKDFAIILTNYKPELLITIN